MSTAQQGLSELNIWRITDRRPGHDSQSTGLARAIAARHPARIHDLPGQTAWHALWCWLRGGGWGANLPPPDLLIGAGHATHWSLLCGRHRFGGRSVVLMSPTLPAGLFDFCLVPRHDQPRPRPGLVTTRGPINRLRAVPQGPRHGGLILLGGPSRHFRWRLDRLLAQLEPLLRTAPGPWTIADSPRTPAADWRRLQSRFGTLAAYRAWAGTTTDWLSPTLHSVSAVWVTTDSMSMLFEALTAGAAVGVLELDPRGNNKLQREIRTLIDEGMVTSWQAWQAGTPLRAPDPPLDEAARCAGIILDAIGTGAV